MCECVAAMVPIQFSYSYHGRNVPCYGMANAQHRSAMLGTVWLFLEVETRRATIGAALAPGRAPIRIVPELPLACPADVPGRVRAVLARRPVVHILVRLFTDVAVDARPLRY